MLSEKTEILRLIQAEPGRTVASILEHYEMKDHKRRENYVRELIADDFLRFEEADGWPFVRLFLTSKGEEFLERTNEELASLEKARKAAASAKIRSNISIAMAFLALCVAILTFLFSFVFE